MSITRLIIHGAHGRMGQRIHALAQEDERFEVVAALGRADDIDQCDMADVVIDFSAPNALSRAVRCAADRRAALLVGTTGLERANHAEIGVFARAGAVMVAPNTSVGVAVLAHLVAEAARLLPAQYDVSIVEAHHARKVDAPSGTALRLRDAIESSSARRVAPDDIHAVRAGDIVGEHTVWCAGDQQVLRLTHEAQSRDVFAHGALDAACWMRGRAPGMYTIEQAIGLAPETPGSASAH